MSRLRRHGETRVTPFLLLHSNSPLPFQHVLVSRLGPNGNRWVCDNTIVAGVKQALEQSSGHILLSQPEDSDEEPQPGDLDLPVNSSAISMPSTLFATLDVTRSR